MTSNIGLPNIDGSDGTDENDDTGIILAIGGFTVGLDTFIIDGNAYYHGTGAMVGGDSQKWRIVVFSDNGSGAPTTTVLASSEEITIDDSTSAGFVTGSFPGSPTLTPGTKVWVALWFGTKTGTHLPQIYTNHSPPLPLDHMFYNTSATYSSTADPVVSSWSDTGASSPSYVLSLTMAPVPTGGPADVLEVAGIAIEDIATLVGVSIADLSSVMG